MKAVKLYTCRGIESYIALCDDGEYRHTSKSMRLLGCIVQDYIPRRIGRGAEDVTDTPEGRVILNKINSQL